MAEYVIEIDCGGYQTIQFVVTNETLRDSVNFWVRAAYGDEEGNPDDDTRAGRAAMTVAQTLIERNLGTPRKDPHPIRIYDGPDTWFIPESSVRWVRVHNGASDPAQVEARRSIGFSFGGDQ